MINASQIKPHAPVVCSNNGQFAVVDHMEGADTIKLALAARARLWDGILAAIGDPVPAA